MRHDRGLKLDQAVAASSLGRRQVEGSQHLPPVLLHVGSTQLLLDDATRVHERIRGSNGESSLRVYDDDVDRRLKAVSASRGL